MQSALDPAGREAERIAELFMVMTAGTVVIWLAVVALAVYAPRWREPRPAHGTALIVGGGVAFPLVVLTALMTYGLGEMPRILMPAPAGGVSIDVSAAQWWWRVRYVAPGQPPVELANEIHLPVGRRMNTRLVSADVVHSFWIPPIAGKMDTIPGRVNRLALEPTRTGTFRGACAEFCGASHARMSFVVIVSEQVAFDSWLANQARPAAAPADPVAQRGQAAFLEHGCSTCHTIRGTAALGVVGPDLTHVASRHTLAAGTLPTGPEEFQRWIAHAERLKPGAHMPSFDSLPEDTVASLAAYLAQLK